MTSRFRFRSSADRSALDGPLDGEQGETLLETIMSVLLIATVVMAVIFGLLTVMRSTRTHREAVRSGNEAVALTEHLRQMDYRPCGASPAPLDGYRGASTFAVDGYQASITEVRFLKDRAAVTPPGGESFQPSCPATDQGVQELSVEIFPTTRPANRQKLVFYKRADHCPTQIDTFEGKQC